MTSLSKTAAPHPAPAGLESQVDLYHGSQAPVREITRTGIFGGIFATVSRSAAMSHGDVLHILAPSRPLTDYALNYDIVGAWDAAVAVCGGDEDRAERIMQAQCPQSDDGDAEDGWELQRLRGVLAARLGFDAVEMYDEHGTTWLCLPGCVINPA